MTRVEASRKNISLFSTNPEDIHARLVTSVETWNPSFDPETQLDSKLWKHQGSPSLRKSKATRLGEKLVVTVFWDTEGILLMAFLLRGCMINGDYYARLLRQLRVTIMKKCRDKITQVVFLHDNAPPHQCQVIMKDLAPSDYHLFSHMKRFLQCCIFQDDDETKIVVMEVVDGFQ